MSNTFQKPNLLMKLMKLIVLALIAASACTISRSIISTASATDAERPIGDMRSYRLASGDRITVTVFGQPDLSGDFLIDGAGNIHLPLIGAVAVSQNTIDACQQRLTERLADGLLNNPRVSVRVSEFRPIHILGDVRVPGSYPFRFGLSALGAIALAGGVGLSDVRQSVAMAELLAGEERLKVLDTTRLSLSVRLARMEAERIGKDTFEVRGTGEAMGRRNVSAGKLSKDAAGIAQSDALVREEHAELAAGLKGHEQSVDLMKRQKPRVEKEIEATKEQIASEMRQQQLSQARLNEYSQLAKRGLVRSATELEMQRQVAQHEAKISQLKAQLARLDFGVGDLDIRIQEAENARRLRVANELRETRTRLREVEASLPPVRELLELRRHQAGLVVVATVGLSHWIVLTRGQSGSPRVIDGGMLVEPGDILEVRRLPPDTGSGATPATCSLGERGLSCTDGRAVPEPGDILEVRRLPPDTGSGATPAPCSLGERGLSCTDGRAVPGPGDILEVRRLPGETGGGAAAVGGRSTVRR
jgi:polysaccharide biosynthesis/export protein